MANSTITMPPMTAMNRYSSISTEREPSRTSNGSVFDSGFILGDGIREGLRMHNGAIPFWVGTSSVSGRSQGSRSRNEIVATGLTDRLFQTLEATNDRPCAYSANGYPRYKSTLPGSSSNYWGS